MTPHRRAKQQPPAPLLGGDHRARGVALGVEAIETGTHVDAVVGCALARRPGTGPVARCRIEPIRRLRGQPYQRQIDCSAGRVTRLCRDEPQRKKIPLVDGRTKSPGLLRIATVVSPSHHGAHCAHRAIAIVNLQAETLRRQFALDVLERHRCFPAQDAFGSAVAGQGVAGEIVGRGITHVLHDCRRDIAQVDEARREDVACVRRCRPKK